MTAGNLDYRATFAAPVKERDEDGGVIQRHEDQFTVWAGVRWLRGGEAVMQSRMQSRSPAILTVRKTPDTDRITSEWRVALDGREFDVKEDPRPSDDRGYLEMLAEDRGQ